MRAIFETTRKHAPAINFIIDIVARKRDALSSDKQVERRIELQQGKTFRT